MMLVPKPLTPGGHIRIAERGTPLHSIEMREAAASPEAHDRAALMAGAIARTALDVLSDEEFFAAVRREFQAILPPLQPPVNPAVQSSTG